MSINIWENRGLSIDKELSTSDRQREINYLLSSGGNFISIINPQEINNQQEERVIKVDNFGEILDYGFMLNANTIAHIDQEEAINRVVDALIALVAERHFLAEINKCSIKMGEIFWLKMQLQNLIVSGFSPSDQLKNRLDKLKKMVGNRNQENMEELIFLTKENQ